MPNAVASEGPGARGPYAGLSSVNPLLFLILYLALIPAFAGGYCWLAYQGRAQQFYAPYARFEPTSLLDKRRVELNVRAALLRAQEANTKPDTEWLADPDALDVYHLDAPKDGEASFTLYLNARRVVNGKTVEGIGGPFELTLDTKQMRYGDPATVVCHFVTTPELPKMQAPYAFDFGLLFTAPPPVRQQSSICWSPADDAQLGRLLVGWKGDPRALSGFFGRMLYFSATTITTVGFGDIIPLSGGARALVGFESMMGWVMAGLFLNALAWRAGQSAARRASVPPPAP